MFDVIEDDFPQTIEITLQNINHSMMITFNKYIFNIVLKS